MRLGCDICGRTFDDYLLGEDEMCPECGLGILMYDYVSIFNEDLVYNDELSET